jgi:transcriptional regulator with XRE-family HTH domain
MCIAPEIDTMYLYQHYVLVNAMYRKRYEVSMTPTQARAARAILKLGVREVAEAAKVTPNTVSRVEQDDVGPRGPQPVTVDAIRRVYEERGVVFIPENGGGAGVRLAKPKVTE